MRASKIDRWRQIETLLNSALDEPEPAKRKLLLDRICANDPELRAEVESLLAHDGPSQTFIESPAYTFAAELLTDDANDGLENHQVGAYKVIREIGRGGMGAVYLAMRGDDAFDKQVAIKLIKRGMDTDAILSRFVMERQILAQLDHPNIARLLDGGTTPDNLPYIVMEYVDGIPITDYCDRHRLTTNERLNLFRIVCDAVQHAHQNLVVHRDLKPSNVLITRDGVPKLLDFGISKVLEPELSALSIERTRTEFRMLTPDYTSPEQVRGEKLTTTSDVYSLGVMLYELLTGVRPHRVTNSAPHELARLVCEQEPAKPSHTSADSGLRIAELHNLRHRESAIRNPQSESGKSDFRNPKFLRGDLDNIVLMALRKDPQRRYESAAQLSSDIERHLTGLPVIARKDTFKYRTNKFVKRNKVGVAAAVIVALSLITGLAVAITQARIANQRRVQAERATASAEKTSRFMQSFLSYANPYWYGRGRGRLDVTVREAIDDAAGRIDTELAENPEVRGDLHHTIGDIYRLSGEGDKAHQHFQQSLALFRQVYGERHPKVAMAMFYLATTMYEKGSSPEEIEQFLRHGIQIMRETGPENVNLPYMLQALASWIMTIEKQSKNESRLAEAESLILESRVLFVRHYGEDHGATLTVGYQLAQLALTRGDLPRAESIQEEFLRRIRQLGEGHEGQVGAMVSLAKTKLALGKGAEGETLIKQALELGNRQWGTTDFRFQRLLKDVGEARAASRK
jgi:eukaryotic-like serine/threonine-protein kinase